MADKTVSTRHAITGQVDNNTPVHIARHPVLGKHLVEVPEGTKPFVPELISHKLGKGTGDAPEPEVSEVDTAPVETPEPKAVPTPKKIGKD